MSDRRSSILAQLRPERVGARARSETRQREKIVPPVSSYRWWARRTMAVTDSILAAYKRLRGEGGLVADPFVGGGIVAFAALARGYQIYAQDINSWVAHGLATTLRLPPSDELLEAKRQLEAKLQPLLDEAYKTEMASGHDGIVTHTVRVAAATCPRCGIERRLYPYAMTSLVKRKETKAGEAFLACRRGHLFRSNIRARKCVECTEWVDPDERYLVGRRTTCPSCGLESSLADLMRRGVTWLPILVQRAGREQRELSHPSEGEIERSKDRPWNPTTNLGPIPLGVETRVLLRHGFQNWESLYPARQRAVLESLLQAVAALDVTEPVLMALELAAVGVAETAGYASRWDRWYLKNYETMALHRFNFTTLSAEPNVWGAYRYGRGTFSQRVRAMAKASDWLRSEVGNSVLVEGPWDSSSPRSALTEDVAARVVLGSSERMALPDAVVNLVLTDPPYHDDVQYGELSMPLRAWAKLGVHDGRGDAAVNRVNGNAGDVESYRGLLSNLFREIHRVLESDGRFVFSYANKEPTAWIALFQALEDAGFHAVEYQVVHAENETGPWKAGMVSCDSDLLLEASPRRQAGQGRACADRNRHVSGGNEGAFLSVIGEQFLSVGNLGSDWQGDFKRKLLASPFLAPAVATEGQGEETGGAKLKEDGNQPLVEAST